MRKLVLGLAALLALLVVVDFGAAIATEYRVSRAVRGTAALGSDPEVSISAFPFLWSVPRGHASAITVSAQDVPTPIAYRTTVESRFTGVRFPDDGIIADPRATIRAEHATASWVIGQTTLGRLLGVPDLEVSEPPAAEDAPPAGALTYGPPLSAHRVLLTGTVQTSADESGPVRSAVSVVAYLVLDKGMLSIVPSAVWPRSGAPGIDPEPVPSIEVVGPQFAVTIDARALPYGLDATRVHSAGTNIVVQGDADDVRVRLTELVTPRDTTGPEGVG
ncbi:LmeA family phospholipid-binding protein [Tomitella gaofuii]|uniref:LmeA family phospholipid-binding protein n=1 Tax=Tomitella gaofuii TaxID=2760083 RepID=UPI0015FE3FFA|nr:LmeA family phospholipid-binding protein [Tomitella gaofuii]